MGDFQPSLTVLADQAARRGILLASTLGSYQQIHQLADSALATQIGITDEQLVHLKLCEVPRREQFDEDVLQIAKHLHIDPVRLARVLAE